MNFAMLKRCAASELVPELLKQSIGCEIGQPGVVRRVEVDCQKEGCIRMGREWVAALGCDRFVAAGRERVG